MAATILRAPEIRVDALLKQTVAILGFGAQGRSHALNLRDSGCSIIVGTRHGGRGFADARAAGFEPVNVASAAQAADVVVMGLPDDAAPQVYREQIEPNLRDGKTLGFIHGFNIHYRLIVPPAGVDVVMVAPKAQGRGVRRAFEAGGGVFALFAVHQDATGRARDTALAWAAGLGCGRAGVIETTFAVETETDLFGEQAVLCGGLSALIKAGFETLVEAGYPPEAAYFECCHELKLITDLIHEGGLTYMRERISSTARFGDLTRGPRVVGEATRREMRRILEEIRSGDFTRDFLEDQAAGRARADGLLRRDQEHPVERIGRGMRERASGMRGGEA